MYLLDFYRAKNHKVRSVTLERTVTVGRSRESDVLLADRSVSRHHATFTVEEGLSSQKVVLRDEGSTNGVVVNGRTLRNKSIVIEPGDRIHLGVFRIELAAQARADELGLEDASQTLVLAVTGETPLDTLPAERLRALCELMGADKIRDAALLARTAALAVAECLSFDRLLVLLEEKQSFHLVAWGPDGPIRAEIEESDRPLIERSRATGATLVAFKGKEDAAPLEGPLTLTKPASVMCLPIATGPERPFGTLFARTKSPIYTTEDVRFLSLVTRSVALRIERWSNERALVAARDAAEAASSAKTEFLANMSHELRTPLHAILGFARFGLKRGEDAPREKLIGYFREIETGAARLSRVVGDLVDLASLHAGRASFAASSVDIAPILHEAESKFSEALAGKSLRFEVTPGAVDTCCLCDREGISRVLGIVLDNAIRFANPQTEIAINFGDTLLDGEEGLVRALEISVADRGVGIPEDELETIFDAFSQSSLTKDGSGGTGLGLAIARAIVSANDGTIRAENRSDGKGAIFRIAVPRERSSAPFQASEIEPETAAATS